jgi:hypothetical protein
MAGLKYVGADYTEDTGSMSTGADAPGNDIVTAADNDSLLTNAPASQTAVKSAINTAVGTLADTVTVDNALGAFIGNNYLTSGNVYTIALSIGAAGSYTLTYGSQTTTAINVGATATALQLALGALSNLETVTVTGQTGGPYTVNLSPISVGAFSYTSSLTTGSMVINQNPLIPTGWGGLYVAPLNGSGVIPSTYVPSLGQGYVLGPFGTTALYAGTTGATPLKIADWNIGAQGINFQPMVFMNLLASAANGGRPVVDVRISQGAATYSASTLIARGVGRNCWSDTQAITVIPFPASAGHTGVAGSGYGPNYNTWLSAWLWDYNAQGVTVAQSNIFSGAAFLIRYE